MKEKKVPYSEYQKETLKSVSTLTEAYDNHGWPGPDLVGADCTDAFWFVAASAVYDSEFQGKTVAAASNALTEGRLSGRLYAGVKDRYLTLSKRQTIYGLAFGAYYDCQGEFQLYVPGIEDPEDLDKRRAAVGHVSFADEYTRLAREARVNDWKYSTRAQAIEELNRVSREGGYT